MSQSSNRTQLNESLSALVDNEASELEIHRLLASAEQDAEIRERWHRYQLARAAIKGEAVGAVSMDFADGIRQAVSSLEFDEPVQQPGRRDQQQGNRLKANAGRAAIAASVAAVVLVGAQQLQLAGFGAGGQEEFAQQTPESSLPVAPSSINIPTINVQNVSGGDVLPPTAAPRGLEYAPSIQQQQLQDEQIRRYIRQLMFEHAESAAQNSGSGLLPYTRVPVEEER